MEIVQNISFGFCLMLARHDGTVKRAGLLVKSNEYKTSFVIRKKQANEYSTSYKIEEKGDSCKM